MSKFLEFFFLGPPLFFCTFGARPGKIPSQAKYLSWRKTCSCFVLVCLVFSASITLQLKASSGDDDFYLELDDKFQCCPVDKYSEHADALSEALNSPDEEVSLPQTCLFSLDSEGISDLSSYKPTEREAMLQEYHCLCEEKIFTSISSFLRDRRDRGLNHFLEDYRHRVKEKKYASDPAYELGKQMLHTPNFEKFGRELLEFLSTKISKLHNPDFSDVHWIHYMGTLSSIHSTLAPHHRDEEKEAILQKYYWFCETEIFNSISSFLRDRRDRGFNHFLEDYRHRVKEKNYASDPAYELGKQMLHTPNFEKFGRELLEFLSTKISELYKPDFSDVHWHYMDTESSIHSTLAFHYLDLYNACFERNMDDQSTRPMFLALERVVSNLDSDPRQDWDDIECSWRYIHEFSRRQLRKIAFRYLQKPRISPHLQVLDYSTLRRGKFLLQATTYGVMDAYCDLLYLLRTMRFTGVLSKTPDHIEQHIWIKFPLQVRITKRTGEGNRSKITVALLQDDPFKHYRQHGSVPHNQIHTRGGHNESLKLSLSDEGEYALVPAFVKEQKYQDMWRLGDAEQRKRLMGEAHFYIEGSNDGSAWKNFRRARRFLTNSET